MSYYYGTYYEESDSDDYQYGGYYYDKESDNHYDDNHYADDLVSIFNGLSIEQKNAVVDCGECFTCEHLTVCDSFGCDTCEKAVEIGCQNEFCKLHNCRENSLKCTCTTERLLIQYADTRRLPKGAKEVFGWFNCFEKRGKNTVVCKRWNSAHAWIEMGKLLTQQCQRCEQPCKPVKVKQKEWRGQQEASGERPHDEVKFSNKI